MSIQVLIKIVLFLIIDLLSALATYKAFIKYRYNEMLKINLNKSVSQTDEDFETHIPYSYFLYGIILLGAIGFLTYAMEKYVLYASAQEYLFYFSPSFLCHLPLIFIFIILFNFIVSYRKNKDDFQNYLFYACFFYKGNKTMEFVATPKHKKYTNLPIKRSDIIEQADAEKRAMKLIFVIVLCMTLIFQSFGITLFNCFDDKKITISYNEYEYSDIVGIYKPEKFVTFFGKTV